jgi:hypothetical protein
MEDGFDSLQAWPMLLGGMKGRSNRLNATQVWLHVRRAARCNQPLNGVSGQARLEHQPNRLVHSKGICIGLGGFAQEEPFGREPLAVVPNDGFRPRGQPQKGPPVFCQGRPRGLRPYALFDFKDGQSGFVGGRSHWTKSRTKEQDEHQGGAHAFSTRPAPISPPAEPRRRV